MAKGYTIRIFVPEGDPDGTKIVELLNWTGVGIAFPRNQWDRVSRRDEFKKSGVYILMGSSENSDDDLPTIYVGQGDEIRTRIDTHAKNKDFWDWGFAFVSKGEALNRAHITWLEYALVQRARSLQRCHPDNLVQPAEPSLSESEKADIEGFLAEMLKILPLLGVQVFEKAETIEVTRQANSTIEVGDLDTVVVPAQEDGFKKVFLDEGCWYAIRISGGMLPKLKYIVAYQTRPVSAVTHWAPIKNIVAHGNNGKYKLNFSEQAKELAKPIPLADAPAGSMQGPRYCSFKKLESAKKVMDLFDGRTFASLKENNK